MDHADSVPHTADALPAFEWRNVVVARPPTAPDQARNRALWLALAIALSIHVTIFIALRDDVVRRAADQTNPIAVQLIDLIPAPQPASEIPPEPIPQPVVHSSPRVVRERTPVSEPPIVATPAAPPHETTPALHLYNADGTLSLPTDATPRVTSRALDAPPVADNTIMTHIRPLKVRPNHFDASWQATHGGNPLDRFIANHLTKSTGVMRLPWGTRVQCAWIVIVAGCAWGPADYWHGDQSWKPATMLDEH